MFPEGLWPVGQVYSAGWPRRWTLGLKGGFLRPGFHSQAQGVRVRSVELGSTDEAWGLGGVNLSTGSCI